MSRADDFFIGRRVVIGSDAIGWAHRYEGRGGEIINVDPDKAVFKYRVLIDGDSLLDGVSGECPRLYFAASELELEREEPLRPLCYYAHCMSLYSTPTEVRDIRLIESLGFRVENPNDADGVYDRLATDVKAAELDVMDTVFLPAVERCDALAFRALPDGAVPSGVFKEVMRALRLDLPVFEIPQSLKRRELTLAQTREYLGEVGER